MTNTVDKMTLTGAVFTDGTTLSGSWTVNYNSSGAIVSITDIKFTVTSPGGTTTIFTSGYATSPSPSPGDNVYQMLLSTGNNTNYSNLYIDWASKSPTSLYGGTNTGVYTSIVKGSSKPMGLQPASGKTPAKDGSITNTCFLAGTNILTDQGEVVVEELLARHQAGVPSRVATIQDGQITYRDVIWVGMRHIGAAVAAAADGCPIRIRIGAFAENVPHRDLLVTPEHCLFVAGRLIPARMLVNHRSIIEDRTIGSYSYYHVELAHHAILLAEGLPTESYLDTGNRSCFSNTAVTTLRPEFVVEVGHRSWSHDACAPLAVDRETVQPIWESLDQRATMLGQGVRAPLVLSDDPQLRLLLSDGQELQPRWTHPGRHVFQIPTGTKPVRLLSRAARPAEVIGSFVDDRRELGVGVAKLVLWDRLDDTTTEAAALALPGWHALEHGIRWTDGDATLDLPVAGHADTFLDIHIAATLRYRKSRAA